jgi:hypothetical protein
MRSIHFENPMPQSIYHIFVNEKEKKIPELIKRAYLLNPLSMRSIM